MARFAADLHLHTIFSDGTFSPRELVKRSKAIGLTTIAITDHDDVDGVQTARVAGDKTGVRVIPGVELSVHHNGIEIHLLGLFLDVLDASFLELLQRLQRMRVERVREICVRLKRNLGVELAPQDVFDIAGDGTPSRAHVAQALVKNGIARDIRDAFQTYIGDRSPGNVAKEFLSMEDAIAAVRRVHGSTVFAHPGLTRHDELLPVFAEMGGHGLETYYPGYSRQQTRHYLDKCKELKLLVSGGSDCHGMNRPELLLGKVRLPEHHVQALERAARFGRVML